MKVLTECEICRKRVIQERQISSRKGVVEYRFYMWGDVFLCIECVNRISFDKEEVK